MATSTFVRPAAASAVPAPAPVGTLLGAGLVIEGEITAGEPLLVEASVSGRIASTHAVTIASGSRVEADVEGTTVKVQGHVVGNIAATERLEIADQSRVVGDVRAPRVSIAEGASFRGRIDMEG